MRTAFVFARVCGDGAGSPRARLNVSVLHVLSGKGSAGSSDSCCSLEPFTFLRSSLTLVRLTSILQFLSSPEDSAHCTVGLDVNQRFLSD